MRDACARKFPKLVRRLPRLKAHFPIGQIKFNMVSTVADPWGVYALRVDGRGYYENKSGTSNGFDLSAATMSNTP
jgi:hypothetical protein